MNIKRFFGLEARVWSAGAFNVLAMALQFWTVISEKSASGVSLGMLLVFVYVQGTFAQVGFRDKVWGQFWGMAISMIITISIIVLTFVY